jgi:hypothetical protein
LEPTKEVKESYSFFNEANEDLHANPPTEPPTEMIIPEIVQINW